MTTISLHLTTVGDPALPKIVFLHGFLGSGSDWLSFARKLENRFCSILVDLPGHGEAGIPADGDPKLFFMQTVEALKSNIRRLRAEPCVLVGYSMGGRIGLALALLYPELFSKAIIVSSSPGLQTDEKRASRRKSDEGIARKIERNFEGFIGFWYDQPLFSTLKSHSLFREVEAQRKQGTPQNLARALRLLGTGNQPSFWDKLPGNRLPMLFCVGEKDAKYVDIAKQVVELCPSSSLELFEHCGHTLHIEEPERFLASVERFIETHPHNSISHDDL
ncbi:MAG TPA: 2-succinyl-6-hydroxy-2,4-cyclohexadiene-1-carboxylate synthase [Chlorobaculum sp.]|uniref:Putative 2-succinyl-6-hydroxy-2,4-cyclohexadiene-1-carboxylate synthase n=1 Tax=Chlorobaculum tepidum (strain ATCC 49652 / DSM 12025 / NBRC 103806 / TLS) TaxID=194439 RepID=Q8KBE3_CHLTE|nr:2-succinyl-6-hydroxy-2,4-cyclohexadiene-1-carboxylate synthase [Chlorobaculum tepidum]AAM73065.1 thioesterase, menaquinone synthesis gene [Chlorobaculum tepidum TLS]HBU24202.1 2-succinyl-6-hydroxy-2,4-cyclohexadiene-1-carboxylate synthase [Chlorobaculum sp.]